jgi:hypothetical protein
MSYALGASKLFLGRIDNYLRNSSKALSLASHLFNPGESYSRMGAQDMARP